MMHRDFCIGDQLEVYGRNFKKVVHMLFKQLLGLLYRSWYKQHYELCTMIF